MNLITREIIDDKFRCLVVFKVALAPLRITRNNEEPSDILRC